VEVNSLHPPPAALDEHLEGQQLLDAEDHAILALHTNSRAANRARREGSGEAWRAREREERRGANTFERALSPNSRTHPLFSIALRAYSTWYRRPSGE
jgi:hypothetical protein